MQKKKYKAAWWAMMSVVLAFLIFCGIGVISAMTEYTEADAEYEEIREVVRKTEQTRLAGIKADTEKSSVGMATGTDRSIDAEMDRAPHTIRGAQKTALQILEENLKTKTEEIEEAGKKTPILINLDFAKGLADSLLSNLYSLSNRAAANQAMFEALHEINRDICGWIKIYDTVIDYPLMHGETNDTYLRTSYNGTYSVGGSIFIDAANSPDFTDMHTIIYGHNMADGTMFKGLYHYLDSSFRDRNPYVYIDLPDRLLVYEVFSTYNTVYWDEVYDEQYEAGPGQLEFILRLMEKADYPVDYEPKEDDRIITLSTCNGGSGTDYRFLVHAVLVKEIR